MEKMIQVIENGDGWSDWMEADIGVTHKISCCDCGLTHNIEYDAVFVVETEEGGKRLKKILNELEPDVVIKWRAGRNRRSTGQIRRYYYGKSTKYDKKAVRKGNNE
jgi:hypothetical protein